METILSTPGDMEAYVLDLKKQVLELQEIVKHLQAAMRSDSRQMNSSRLPIYQPIRPDTFAGMKKGQTVEAWLFQLRQYFEACQMDSNIQVPFAASLLRDEAAIWWRYHVEDYDAGHEERITDWDDFKNILIEQFCPVNAIKQMHDKLADLK